MAKTAISKDFIGAFEFGFLLVNVVSFFWISGLFLQMINESVQNKITSNNKIFTNTFWLVIIHTVLASIIFSYLYFNYFKEHFSIIPNRLQMLMGLYCVLNLPTFCIEQYYLMNKYKTEFYIYAISSFIIPAFVLFIAFFGFETILAIEISITFLLIIKWLFLIRILLKQQLFDIEFIIMKNIFVKSIPLTIAIFIGALADYFDDLFIKTNFKTSDYATYKYGAKEFPILIIITTSMATMLNQKIGENLEDGLNAIKEITKKYIYFFYTSAIVLMLCSTFIYTHVFNVSFRESAVLFNLYLFLVVNRVLFPQSIITGLGLNKYLLYSSVMEFILHIIVLLICYHTFGLKAAAIATFASYSFDKIYLIYILKTKVNIKLNKIVPLRTYFIANLVILSAFIFWYFILK